VSGRDGDDASWDTHAQSLDRTAADLFARAPSPCSRSRSLFSLPGIANYILNEWWPEVQNNANLLLATEVGSRRSLHCCSTWRRSPGITASGPHRRLAIRGGAQTPAPAGGRAGGNATLLIISQADSSRRYLPQDRLREAARPVIEKGHLLSGLRATEGFTPRRGYDTSRSSSGSSSTGAGAVGRGASSASRAAGSYARYVGSHSGSRQPPGRPAASRPRQYFPYPGVPFTGKTSSEYDRELVASKSYRMNGSGCTGDHGSGAATARGAAGDTDSLHLTASLRQADSVSRLSPDRPRRY